jgi:hypothetical protein
LECGLQKVQVYRVEFALDGENEREIKVIRKTVSENLVLSSCKLYMLMRIGVNFHYGGWNSVVAVTEQHVMGT